ncbi:hypothetical protein [Kitasatospora phosalacinea]|uniref:Uncharacterized protein n=1 Tax=Kitasatospora phosalacinea TaxID=2065 RepID=A0A9W6UN68_9ACTN|nr:hypothetical protein [Kitasatospora phosalacinea]GLW53832.1 hypothetical protein Kpho01_18430 [Kitasatospora phosalacinea]
MNPTSVLLALLLLTLLAGVVLPAVWSRRPERRSAARGVLRMLLTALRRDGDR